MKAYVALNQTRASTVSGHVAAMADGLRRHGIEVTHNRHDMDVDFAVGWSWRKGKRIKRDGFQGPVLVMERGYLGDRLQVWTSLGWDGLNGRARWNEPQDSGERFWKNFGGLVCEWEQYDGYALLIGQVEGDMALEGVNVRQWYSETASHLDRLGWDVRFRPHPESVKRGHAIHLPDYMVMREGSLQDAFSEAGLVVTWNSNTGVESVLAGIPTIAMDEGAMAWPVTSHSLHEEPVMPSRDEWLRVMAWRQWTIDEIQSGEAWDVVKGAM